MKPENPEISTDPRQNVIPDAPQGYYRSMYEYVLPKGFDLQAEKEKRAVEYHRLGLNLKQAGDLFDKDMRTIIDTHRTAHAQGVAEEREANEWSPIEADNRYEQIINDRLHPYNNDKASAEMRNRANFVVEALLRCKNGERGWSDAKVEEEYRRQKQEGFKTFSDVTRERVTTPLTDHTSRSYDDVNEPARRQNGNPAPQIDGQELSR